MYYLKQIHIQNFRNIEYQTIQFWKNKTVFVWKNGSWKTVILQAIDKLLNAKKIKEKDFRRKEKKIILEAIVSYNEQDLKIKIESYFEDNEIINKTNFDGELQKDFLEKTNVIYIPSDREINKDDSKNGYIKLIDLIIRNKELKNENIKDNEIIKNARKKLSSWRARKWATKTTILISLLKLYLYSIQNLETNSFTIFLIDQPENFLHPHATKMIDNILQSIWEQENTKVCYATHSPELVSNFKKWTYEIDNIVFVKEIDGKCFTKRVDNRNWRFNKIMISLIFKNASVFFSDAVILVEWETEKISVPNIFENSDLKKYCSLKCKHLTREEKVNYFNLNYKNISVVDVWWKWALSDWFVFASELFWKENVVAMIDRDENFFADKQMILKAIRQVYKVQKVYENDFRKYNWIVLDWEFENYYKIDAIRNFLIEAIERKTLASTIFSENKLEQNIKNLDQNLKRLKHAKKISTVYESIFSSYFRRYSKPTIAFNLSTWLCENNWYDEELLKIFSFIIEKLDNNEKN